MVEDTRKRLGRGLSALLGDMPEDGGAPSVDMGAERNPRDIPIDLLSPNPANPRRAFQEEPLDELATSIRERGIMQPLLVRRTGAGYEIIAGERRWRAAQKAGLHRVPVIVRDVSAGEALELAIIENVQRTDLNAIEEASGYQRLIDEFGHKHDALGRLIGKSRSHVANMLRLLNLPPSIRASVADGSLSAGHARALLGVENAEAVADEVIRKGLSVRATEQLVAKLRKAASEQDEGRTKSAKADDPDTRALVRRLSDRLGLPVHLNHNTDESGTLSIRYTSLEQLDAVCRMLGES